MANTLDLAGQKFNRLTAVKRVELSPGRFRWLCRCDCGNEAHVTTGNLRSGHTKSCGCFKGERVKVMNKTHGMVYTPTYKSWLGMRDRCNCPNNSSYPRYGGRGITICERWDSFEAFLSDMGEAPPGNSIERIDNNKGYCPENCRWATKKEQALNRRTTRWVTAHGRTLPLKQWAELTGEPYLRLYKRFKRLGFPKIDPGLIPAPKDEVKR